MSNEKSPIKADEIRQEVDEFYKQVSAGQITTAISPEALYQSLGYDISLLKELPEEVRLGLSCGNPLEHLFLDEGETLLDLGSGTGMDVFLARRKFPQAKMIYGMDRLPQMIEKAQKALSKLKFSGVEFKLGTLTDMPFADGSVDKVISNCVINLEPDKKKVYQEIYRVLRPGGMFFISDITLKQELSESIRAMKDLHGS